MGTLLRKLGDLVAERYTLLGGMHDEIQELKDELESMTACFRDVAGIGDDDMHKEQMRTWMKQVREIGYDAEDCIDIFLHHLSKHSGDNRSLGRHIHKIFNFLRTLKVRLKLVTEIQSIKSRAQKVSERRLRYKLDAMDMKDNMPSSSSYVDVDRRLPALHGDESPLVGMAENKQKVIDLLNKDDMKLRVISVVGIGGLGKTTLAMAVLNSREEDRNQIPSGQPNILIHAGQPNIQIRAVVPVSRTYDLRALLQYTVRELHRRPIGQGEDPLIKDIGSWDIPKLIQRSREHLVDKRYLVIIDDVWHSTAWEQLKVAFPDNGKGSRIVVTTRSDEVATNCSSSNGDIYKMEALTEADSKMLLFHTVFGSETIPSTYQHLLTSKLEDVCNVVFKKSGGLPLAIVSIGGMLTQRKNESVDNWENVIQRIPSELQKGKMLDGMRRILSLSYNDLPYHLKACFLYLSVFPEDHEIRRGPLVRRWEAEGFINEVYELSLEEISTDYFNGFVSRSVVAPEQLSGGGEVRSFKVHDIMLDIITAKSTQENLMSTLGNHQHSTVGHDKIRRVSIQPGSRDNYFSRGNLRHVRSLTIMSSREKPKDITFSNLKLLRVLDLEGCSWSLSDKDWKEICKLTLLRYLSIRRTGNERLPSKLGKLTGLVTLDVRQTKVTHFPKSITQLQNLQHLLAGEYVHYTRTHSVKHFAYRKEVVKIPTGLSKMKALKRISFVDVKGKGIEALHEVAKLSQLTRLCAMQTDPNASWGNFSDTLSDMNNSLRYLSVMQDEANCNIPEQLNFLHCIRSPPVLLQSLHLLGRINSLPQWFQSLSKLSSLSLRHNYLETGMVDVLGRLPCLISLKLYDGSYTGTELSFTSHQFPMLKQLVIDNLPNLVKLSFDSGAPANLERLTLFLPRGSAASVLGIRKLLKLRAVELFGINDGHVVNTVMEEVNSHPNMPIRVTRDDQPPPPSS
ncbi:hypothetical protein HU200_056951 [Digitaria exilis]|uniref:Uncharacterized protein n=1 Tax=Digitaria exilis TaxID=1010633 RepID=A0A835ABV0_9POAL|nr:hypothetical protein HU200_056951 [Digitaria exilis]